MTIALENQPSVQITENGRLHYFMPSGRRTRKALRAECQCGWHSYAYRKIETVKLVRTAHEANCLQAQRAKAGQPMHHLALAV